jgi:hypothetical protein
VKYAGWVFLALYMAYRRMVKACDCEGLRRRLVIAHRETRDWQAEARIYEGLVRKTYPTVD